MKYFFTFSLANRPENCLTPARIFEVSKKVKEWLTVKSPRLLHQFPALPYALYAFTYNMLPTDVRKYYRPVHKANKGKTIDYYSLRSLDELGDAAIDKMETINHPVVF